MRRFTGFLCILLLIVPAMAQNVEDPLLDLPVTHPSLDISPPTPATPPPPPPTPPQPQPLQPPPSDDPKPAPVIEDPRDIPPPTIYGEEISSENDTLYYVIDISGSMSWDSLPYIGLDGQKKTGNRMDRAKVELIRSIVSLPRNFRFNIIAFDCMTFMWSRTLQVADDFNKQNAITWVSTLMPRDATGTGPAVSLALGDRLNQTVVLLTDGAPNCGVPAFATFATTGMYNETAAQHQHRIMITNNNSHRVRINVFGIAANGSYRMFCQNVASDSGGSYTDVQ